MKVTLKIKLTNGMELPIAQDVNTFADLRRFGEKLRALPGNANKLIPGVADCPVESLGISREKADAAKAA